MRTTPIVAALGLSLVFAQAVLAQPDDADPLDISGTYRFVERELPDGSIVTKGIAGLITFTDEYRNFNIHWTDEEGGHVSLSYIATYELTADEYTETSIYRLATGGEEGVEVTLEPRTGSSPVTVEGESVSFQLPLWGEPRVSFEGDRLTATMEGEFVDRWERVD